jgi:NADH dehydrogenase
MGAASRLSSQAKPVLAVIGSGHAGFEAARTLERQLSDAEADLLMISDTDHLNYSSLLPLVASGVIDPRHNAVALHRTLRRTRILLGEVSSVDLEARAVTVLHPGGMQRRYPWDQLLLTPGSVPRATGHPGVEDQALRFHTLADAVELRDHVLEQLQVADAATDEAERRARCTFIVVGAGYSGTEVTAQLQLLTCRTLPRFPTLGRDMLRWILVEAGTGVLQELNPKLGRHAGARLRARGVDIRLCTTISELVGTKATLSDGDEISSHSVIWTAGITPSPLVARLNLPTERGRVSVAPDLGVPGHPDVFAAGDAAAVPDLTRPGQLCGQTAQHATRQGVRAGQNMAARLRGRPPRNYRHRDLGFVVDLGGRDAAANPLHLPLTGLAAKVVTLGYHLWAIPTAGNKLRVGTDLVLNAIAPDQDVRVRSVNDETPLRLTHNGLRSRESP